MGGGKYSPLLAVLAAMGGCAVPEPAACVAPCEALDIPPLLFGLDRFHFRMFEDAALPLIEALGPGSKTTDTPEEGALMRSVERYAWRDCSFRASFYFAGLWNARALEGVRLQIAADAPQACFADIAAEIAPHFGPPHSLLGAARTGYVSARWADRLERFDAWEDRPGETFQFWVRVRKRIRPVAIQVDRYPDASGLDLEPTGAGDIFLLRVDTRPQAVSRAMPPEALPPSGLRG